MPRPPRISRPAVLDEALRTLDEEGIEALSMRRLAQRLGVTSPSLYKYVRDREGVFEAVVDAIVQEINEGWSPTGSWRAELDGMARRYFRTFRRHPHAVPLVMHRPTRNQRSLDSFDTVLNVLTAAGWPVRNAARAVLLTESYALGATLTAVSPGVPLTSEDLASRPTLAAALIGEHSTFRLTEEDFEHGLKLVLDGIARELAPERSPLEH
ncbi:TetR/AcrR family transcriptional regulator C-terminal domain-containing protein [Streptomyces oryzae]|uniref:TetR/AcrR family transcriptional regulator C-terminal domain-containing protein n=1 Tax=Streptomyces oryzae TaxID=1434886 RepID=A0ABS3XJJ9_9ACTN|nr:TetR/AcrR family transcriptional regulator C-terminal domain-containing protein [Streptomyces oryzae]MBO8195585.1 TetR/AcrR family transcriptional regulator C-terminal domain-containing protein [Streptomyces oryzae]